MSKFDFEQIKERYKKYYREAIRQGRRTLPYYEIQPWDQVLNEVESRAFEDIRYFGIPLYPVFPIDEDRYLHFANPFQQIGIEIVYKNSSQSLVTRKVEFLKAEGWTIYTITSKAIYHTIEEFFRIKRKRKDIEWENLSNDMQFNFVKKYHKENAVCLFLFIQWQHFHEQYYQECKT
jgi:hypothetical protein